MKTPVALFTSFGLQNLFIHGTLCTNKVDYLILWLITSIIAVMVTLVEITQNNFRWPTAASYLMDTRFEFFKLRKDSYMLLSSGGPSGHTNGDGKPSSHLALYHTPLEITQHEKYTQTVGYTVPFLYVHVCKHHAQLVGNTYQM